MIPHPDEVYGAQNPRSAGSVRNEAAMYFGTAEEAGEKHRKTFLQGLKPIGFRNLTPGLKPRPPKEKTFSASCETVP